MTLEEFYTALAACQEQFAWHDTAFLGLRGYHPQRYHPCCPITAVALQTLGAYWPVDEANDAAEALQLTPEAATQIIAAADLPDNPRVAAIRARLRACVGLRTEVA